jgi:SAM-dependent methyltransferase
LDEISEQLRQFIAAAPRAREPHLPFLRKAASELAPRESILDVGSGLAPYRELFDHARYVTCDWELSSYTPPIPPDIRSSADHIPVDDASFDAILCTQVLEHVAEPWTVLEEFHRVIRPGGKIWITAPLTWYLHEQPYDYYRFTSHGLRHLLERARFSEVEILPLTDAFTTLAQLVGDLGYLMGEAQDGHDEERGLVAAMMRHLADLIGSLSGFDTQWILPIDFCAEATRPLRDDEA